MFGLVRKKTYDILARDYDDLHRSHRKSTQWNTDYCEQVIELRKENNELRVENEDLKTEIAKLNREITVLRMTYDDHTTLATECERLKKECASLTAKVNFLSSIGAFDDVSARGVSGLNVASIMGNPGEWDTSESNENKEEISNG